MPPSLPQPTSDHKRNRQPTSHLPLQLARVCPECAGPLARASGCVTCTQCGWGRCG